jgi:ubiquinone/menaquinone biosynthesis C-methylase UbiE
MKNLLRKIKREFIESLNFNKLVRNSTKTISNQMFKQNLSDFDRCFSDKKILSKDIKIIDRIMSAYNKTKVVQQSASIEFQVGNEWISIYESFMSEIINALLENNIKKATEIYENFMRDDCSIGLHGFPLNMKEIYFNGNTSSIFKKKYLFGNIFCFEMWQKLTNNKFNSSDLHMPNFGNPYGFYEGDNFIRTGAPYFHYYANKIDELLEDQNKRNIIFEIGGGYGGMAYFINSKNTSTYIDIDLPENLALTAYYLISCFPTKKILLYGEAEIKNINLSDYDIILLPNFEIINIPTQSVDLVFNSYSLAEMSKKTIDLYISEIQRICKTYFMHVNHTKRVTSYSADDFGIDTKTFKLISRELAPWGQGINLNADEFEFIYKK